MINLEPWYRFMLENIVNASPEYFSHLDDDDLMYAIVNFMSYLLVDMIDKTLVKYTKRCFIDKDNRGHINMKNEFLFTNLILTDSKKRYISTVRLREGNIMNDKLDIKGHDFNKASASTFTKEKFANIITKHLFVDGEINVSDVLRELDEVENEIIASLEKGERYFAIPKSVKELAAYKEPLSEQGVRAILNWNLICPDLEITLPAKIDIVKTNIVNTDALEKLYKVDEEKAKRVEKYIFNSDIKNIAKNKLNIIAIPRTFDRIPDWIIPFINYKDTCNDNLKTFYSVLEALNIPLIKTTSTDEYFSNIIDV